MGEMEAALRNHIEIHNLWVIHQDTTVAEFGTINYYLGTRYFRLSRYHEAIQAFEKAISILPETNDLHWRAQNELVTIHANQGDFKAALKTLPLLLAQREEKLRLARQAPESPKKEGEIANRLSSIGTMKANQGILFYNVGNVKNAVPTYEEGVKLIKEAYGSENRLYLDYAPVLLIMYRAIGQTDRALAFGHELWEASRKAGSPAEAAFVGDALATIHHQLGQNETALSYALVGDSLFIAGEKENSLERASLLLSLGQIYKDLEQYEEGLVALNQSREIMESLSATEHAVAKLSLVQIAEIKGKQGKYAEQIDRLIDAKNSLDPLFKNNLTNYTALLSAKAQAHERLDQLAKATQEYQDLYQLFADQISAQFDAFSEEEQLSWQKVLIGDLHRAQNFMLRHPDEKDMAATAINLDLLFRGIAFGNRKRLFERVRNSSFAEINETYQQWLKTRGELSAQYSKPAQERSLALDSIENEAIRLEKMLARQSQAFKVARELPTWKKISQHLAPDEVFINFVHAAKYDFGKPLPGSNIFAFVIRGNSSFPQMVPLPGLGDLQKLSASKVLYSVAGDNSRNNLQHLIFEPLHPHLAGVNHINYAPAGILHRINFGAIPISAEATISETYSLRRISQVSDWITTESPQINSPKTAALLGGINFEGTLPDDLETVDDTPLIADAPFSRSPVPDSTTLRAISHNGWSELVFTGTEVKEIANRLRQEDYQVKVLSGTTATEEAFKQFGVTAPSPKILHLATHGYFFPSPGQEKQGRPGFESAKHPLVRSGLILAGANRAWRGENIPDGAEDGILTAYEIAEMDLSNTELVVLSACETGLGDIDGSEGVFGLQRAFKMAGAKYVLMSLWNVKDQKTYEFMTLFYKLWQGGSTIPEAYQETQSKMRAKYALPFAPRNWAGFVLLN
jgi:CHAT domain-containing protein/tetratricopeptide (TPR) repeat protein